MSKGKRFYQITTNESVADINIYGDITSWEWEDSDVSAHSIKTEIDALDVDNINVYINSYGGEVAEALAIYSSLKRHNAKVHTYVDGFACSAATIIFCAGDDRTMGDIALFMIHNCMSYVGYGNSEELRKAAEDNDKINQSSIKAYLAVSNLDEDEIKHMMDRETWLTAEECLKYGFATDVAERDEAEETQQSAYQSIRKAILTKQNNPDANICIKLDEILELLNKSLQQGEDEEDENEEDTAGDDSEENEDEESGDDSEDDPEDNSEDDEAEDDEEELDKEDKEKETFNQKVARLFGSLK